LRYNKNKYQANLVKPSEYRLKLDANRKAKELEEKYFLNTETDDRDEDDHDDESGYGRPTGQQAGGGRFGGVVILREGAVVHGFRQRRHAPTSQPS